MRAWMSAVRSASLRPSTDGVEESAELEALGLGDVVEAMAGRALAPRAIPPATAVEARTIVSFLFM